MNITQARSKLVNGNYFRSITEYAWSVFFDECGIRYFYEHRKFETSQGWYLPDFYLPNLGVYIEIKPGYPSITESTKCYDVCQKSGEPVVLLSGMPKVREFNDGLIPCDFGITFWIKNTDKKGSRIFTDKAFTGVLSGESGMTLRPKVIEALKSATIIEDRWNSTLADSIDQVVRDLSDDYRYDAQAIINADKDTSETKFEREFKKHLEETKR